MSMNREQELQHRNDELLMKLTNVVVGYKQLQATIEQQAAKIAKLITESDGWQNRFDLKEQELHQLQMNYEASESHRFVMGESIAKLEKRIRVADAEEPVGNFVVSDHGIWHMIPRYSKRMDECGVDLYRHAQIPADVAELKKKIIDFAKFQRHVACGTSRIGPVSSETQACLMDVCSNLEQLMKEK